MYTTKFIYNATDIILYHKEYNMLSATELRVLELLLSNATKEYTILEIAKQLKIPYPQAHRNVKSLVKKRLVTSTTKAKANLIRINITEVRNEYILAELSRKKKALKRYKDLRVVESYLERIPALQYICIIFGSYAKGTAKRESDIDVLFVIPKEYNYGDFEKIVKHAIMSSKVDINIILEESLHEMWSNPLKLNIGNEVLKEHIILKGVEAFLEAWRKHNVG